MCSILLKGLTAHTHYCGIERTLETEFEDTLLSCAVEALERTRIRYEATGAMPGIAFIACGRDKQSPVVLDIITFSALETGGVDRALRVMEIFFLKSQDLQRRKSGFQDSYNAVVLLDLSRLGIVPSSFYRIHYTTKWTWILNKIFHLTETQMILHNHFSISKLNRSTEISIGDTYM